MSARPKSIRYSFVPLTCSTFAALPAAVTPPAIYTPHERFFPDYFDMARPAITAAAASINYGGTFTIDTPDAADVDEVVLLRAGAVTHGFNIRSAASSSSGPESPPATSTSRRRRSPTSPLPAGT